MEVLLVDAMLDNEERGRANERRRVLDLLIFGRFEMLSSPVPADHRATRDRTICSNNSQWYSSKSA
jgi:hypothetical protein